MDEKLGTNLEEVGTDCISRQAAMKLLRDDWQASESRGDAERAEIAKFHFIEISNLPAAQPEPCEDFVKVVRCKKCRYVHCDKEFDNYWCNRMSGTFMVEAEGFCKWGR